MTEAQQETIATLSEIAPNECESKKTEFHVSEPDEHGYVSFEMYSDNVYRSGEIYPEGYVSWN